MGNNTSRKPNLLIRTVQDQGLSCSPPFILFLCAEQSSLDGPPDTVAPAEMTFNRWNRELTFEG